MLLHKQNVNKYESLERKNKVAESILVVVGFCVAILSSSFLEVSFIVRDYDVAVVRERERVKLVHYSNSAQCFLQGDSDCLYQLFSPMYYLSITCTCTIDFDQFELQRSLIRINFLLPDLQNFKSLESGDVHQNFLSSETWALGLQNLQVFRRWRRSSELLSSESSTLEQKHNLQKLGLFIRTFCLRVFNLVSGQIIRAFRS